MTSFWMIGTSSMGTSTPRSPRATITASTSVRIPPRLATISARSSLATTGTLAPSSTRNFRTSWMSAADRTNETATKSTPCRMPKRRSSLSLSVRYEAGMGRRGRETPLWSEMTPPAMIRQCTSLPPSTRSTVSWIMPSSIQT
jgi:hypothetical protein